MQRVSIVMAHKIKYLSSKFGLIVLGVKVKKGVTSFNIRVSVKAERRVYKCDNFFEEFLSCTQLMPANLNKILNYSCNHLENPNVRYDAAPDPSRNGFKCKKILAETCYYYTQFPNCAS